MIISSKFKSAALPFALSMALVGANSLRTLALADHHTTPAANGEKAEGCDCKECDSCKDAKKCKDGKCKMKGHKHGKGHKEHKGAKSDDAHHAE